MVRELSDINVSGELTTINLGGVAAGNAVQTRDALDTHLGSGNVADVKTATLTATGNTAVGTTTADSMIVNGTLQMKTAESAAYNGSFLRIGTSGVVTYYQPPEQDTTWTAANSSDIAVNTTATAIALTPSLVIDQDKAAQGGFFELMMQVSNIQNSLITLSVEFSDDGTPLGPISIVIGRLTTTTVGFSGQIANAIGTGSVITLSASADATGLSIDGSVFTTTVQVTKYAPAAQVFVNQGVYTELPTKAELSSLVNNIVDNKPFVVKDNTNRMWLVVFDGTDYYCHEFMKAT